MNPSNNKPEFSKEKNVYNIDEIISGIEKSMNIQFPERAMVKRFLKRLIAEKKIQGIYDLIGDTKINKYVDRNYPYTGNDDRNDKLNTLLKSNWYLNRLYRSVKLPLPPNNFTREKSYRLGKRQASLFEWLIGFLFFYMDGNIPRNTKRVNEWIEQRLETLFSEIVNNEKELELTWYEFQKFQAQKKE